MTNKKTICGILHSLFVRKNIQAKLNCVYADGKGYSLISIRFYDKTFNYMIGKIVFEDHKQSVLHCHYRNIACYRSNDVIDLLLDIYHFEMNQLAEVEANTDVNN